MSSPSPPLTPPTSDSEGDIDIYHNVNLRCAVFSAQLQSRTLPESTSSPHPFAGSTKANRPPPSYEKRLFTPPASPPEPSKKISCIKLREPRCELSQNLLHPSPSLDDSEQRLWDTTISSAIDSAKAKIDLSGNNLTYIPPSINDLKNLVVLPEIDRSPQIMGSVASRVFTRSATAPALLPSPQISGKRRFSPSKTMNSFGSAMQRKRCDPRSKCEIELYLMRNAIRALPRELFSLDCLVVLSLRQNKLTSLPPAIGQLTRLRELNVASNRLAHLPAEILKLRLTSLNLHPNPFTSPPCRPPNAKHTRILAPLQREASIPTLSEYALRSLLSPVMSRNKSTWLEEHIGELSDNFPLPDHFQRIIRASTRHGMVSEKGADAEDDVSANICPNLAHVKRSSVHDTEVSGRVFSTPVEMMMEWVGVVAGVQVAENPQAWVPVLWRGCSRGCLAFLEPEEDMEELADDNDVPMFVVGTGEEGETFEFSDEE